MKNFWVNLGQEKLILFKTASPSSRREKCKFISTTIGRRYPRVAAFSDYEGWHNKEFIGNGEFTLEFGDFEVSITAPSDHIVSSTGVLQNEKDVLTKSQIKRLKKAEKSDKPIFIVTPEEAFENEKERSLDKKTWVFKAENVRDFAWASSRKFIWDAAGFKQESEKNPLVMAMSFYPFEGEPLQAPRFNITLSLLCKGDFSTGGAAESVSRSAKRN